MGLQNYYTHTLCPGFRFSLTMHIFGLHSPSRCWIFKVFLFSKYFFVGFSYSHSPTRFEVLTLHLDVWFTLSNHIYIFFFSFRKNNFHTLTLRPGFRFSLSMHIFDWHSPSRYWILIFVFLYFFFNLNFSWGFHPLALQTGFTFSLSMQMLGFNFFFFFSIWIFFSSFILSLSKQVVSSHSRCRSLVYTLQAEVFFFFLYMFLKLCLPLNKNIFLIFSALFSISSYWFTK